MTIRIGLLGAGRIGKVHAKAIAATADARLVAVADAVDAAAQSLAAEHATAVRSIDGIVGADDIDAVFITSPTDTHADLIVASAQAGKAIFCEKPIDLSRQRVRDSLAVVERTGRHRTEDRGRQGQGRHRDRAAQRGQGQGAGQHGTRAEWPVR